MDFAQNFSLASQHEVQSAHFDKPQVTVFTASVVLGSESKNFVILRDYLEHVRSTVRWSVEDSERKVTCCRILNLYISLNSF